MSEDCECDDYEPYYNDPEYGNGYYMCVKTKSGERGKVERYGKRIEYRGRVFYTYDRITEDEDFLLTDAVTGCCVGSYRQLQQRFDEICKAAEKFPAVESLPLAELDYGGYVLVKEKNNEER